MSSGPVAGILATVHNPRIICEKCYSYGRETVMPWNSAPREEVARLKYYGVGGWLLFVYILAVLAFLSGILDLVNPDERTLKLFLGSAAIAQSVSLASMVLRFPFLILVPLKHPLMPSIDITCTWISVFIMMPFIISVDVTMGAPAAVGILIAALVLIVALLWTWYLLASKRVNLTFRHRIPALAMRR